jgi:hypothetical protein
MAKDFYLRAAKRQARALEAAKSTATANLNEARANRDPDLAGTYVQELADLSAAQENLSRLCNQYLQSQQPPQRPATTPEEWQAKPISAMDAADAIKLYQTSKYGKDLDWSNANLRAGYAEAMRRRSRGE